MKCPFCKANNDQVVDSREGEGGTVIRRRRRCRECKKRFTTYEKIEDAIKLSVVKKDGRREAYDRTKALGSVRRACTKLPVRESQIEQVVDEVEEEVFATFDREVPSKFIGERIAGRLRQINEVAYVRFASVYREFRDVTDFVQEAQRLMSATDVDPPDQKMLFDVISRLTKSEDAGAAGSAAGTSEAGAAASDGELAAGATAEPGKTKPAKEPGPKTKAVRGDAAGAKT